MAFFQQNIPRLPLLPEEIESILSQNEIYMDPFFLDLFVPRIYNSVSRLVLASRDGHPNDCRTLNYFLRRGLSNVSEWRRLKVAASQKQDVSSANPDQISFCESTAQECAQAWSKLHTDIFNGSMSKAAREKLTTPKKDQIRIKSKVAGSYIRKNPIAHTRCSQSWNGQGHKNIKTAHRSARAFKFNSRDKSSTKLNVATVMAAVRQKVNKTLENHHGSIYGSEKMRKSSYQNWSYISYSQSRAQLRFGPEVYQNGPYASHINRGRPQHRSGLFSSAPTSRAGSPAPSHVFSEPEPEPLFDTPLTSRTSNDKFDNDHDTKPYVPMPTCDVNNWRQNVQHSPCDETLKSRSYMRTRKQINKASAKTSIMEQMPRTRLSDLRKKRERGTKRNAIGATKITNNKPRLTLRDAKVKLELTGTLLSKRLLNRSCRSLKLIRSFGLFRRLPSAVRITQTLKSCSALEWQQRMRDLMKRYKASHAYPQTSIRDELKS